MSETEVIVSTEKYKKRTQGPEIWRRFKKNKAAVVGMVIIILIFLIAIFAPIIAPFEPNLQDTKERLLLPSIKHLMGTDDFGRDIFSRVVYGARLSISLGFLATIVASFIGAALGAIAGYYCGVIEVIIMRTMDVFMSIPGLLLAIAIAAALGPGMGNMVIAVTISSIPGYCRIVRGAILSVRDQEYIEAANAAGASDFLIIIKHIIPNCMAPLIIQITMRIGNAILICASLSFIGVGISPPTAEWGSMLSKGREYLRDFPHLTLFPGLAIMLTVFSLNIIGDGLRDAFDPKLKT